MKNHSDENSMTLGADYEETTRRCEGEDHEPEFERIYETVDQVEHNFPIATRIRALTLKVDDAIKNIRSSLYQGYQA